MTEEWKEGNDRGKCEKTYYMCLLPLQSYSLQISINLTHITFVAYCGNFTEWKTI